jgi:hypothetical protein
LNQAKVVVACFSDEYVTSQNCALEFRFSHISLRVPVVKAVCGTGNEWRKNELAFLASNYPEINFQYSGSEREALLKLVAERLAEIRGKEANQPKKVKENKEVFIENNSAAFQELYELTQRKFLSQLVKISNSDKSTSKQYPRLFCVDLVEKHKVDALDRIYRAKPQKKSTRVGVDVGKEIDREKEGGKGETGRLEEQVEKTEVPKQENKG